MEPEAARIIWNRSIDKHQLCYCTFIGDGDSKSYQQVVTMDPFPLVSIHKEECLAHVSSRLKKTLCKTKKNTKLRTYIQLKLPEPKAEYISSTFSTVILQHRGKTPSQMANGLNILLSHVGENTTRVLPKIGANGEKLPNQHRRRLLTTHLKKSRKLEKYSPLSKVKSSVNH